MFGVILARHLSSKTSLRRHLTTGGTLVGASSKLSKTIENLKTAKTTALLLTMENMTLQRVLRLARGRGNTTSRGS